MPFKPWNNFKVQQMRESINYDIPSALLNHIVDENGEI